ncbi:hypothetical protein BEWA_028290 [Theileria equi strain WA]|uniref:Uncharacterized protein n=1 Tax=Theileria equi strain WA TaxID=1537102 RepID=L0AWQ8_THEEQ|nr:hypothetical protein BEWA_028290 [Theileria equi strain WA]AFZ79980.1 hypothetical protein BEWA_028290 [Theileria equi strain WA]|eukprot:XP_004829646.1 hypothetical protein BEWA_028290 [Theileria equi strain WA]
MSGDGDGLTLELDIHCSGDEGTQCNCTKIDSISPRKDVSPDSAIGFFALTHFIHEGQTFILKKDIGGNQSIDGGPVKDVESVSVYYWGGNEHEYCETPLLLKITEKNNPIPRYYKRYKEGELVGHDSKIWKYYDNPNNISLQDLLNERNLGINNLLFLNLNDPTTPFKSESDFSKDIKAEPVGGGGPKPLTGTNYIVKEYEVRGTRTRISRVTYNGVDTSGIIPPPGPVSMVRLFSYSESAGASVPLMLQFMQKTGGSEWFYSTHKDGWGRVYDPSGFYNVLNQPTERLSKELDNINCKHYSAVALNLTKSNSTNHAKKRPNGKGYCCRYHSGTEKRVTVKRKKVFCKAPGHNASGSIYYYKHSVQGQKIAAIYYKDGSERKNIKLTGSYLPIDGVKSVSVFYCKYDTPVLIYIAGETQEVSKWYKRQNKSSHVWTQVPDVLQGITPDKLSNIKDCTDGNFEQLVKVLNEFGHSVYKPCNTTSPPAHTTPGETAKEAQDDPNHGGTSLTDTLKAVSASLTDDSTNIIVSVTTGILVTSALACFAGFKLYNRYKGDPWVRYGYPIECLKNVPY